MGDETPPPEGPEPSDNPIHAVSTPQPAPPGVAPAYGFAEPPPPLSMARMREEHVRLLKRMNAEAEEPSADFLADVATFQAGVQEAGAVIAGPDERSELQSTINFWQTVRIHAGQRPATMLVCAFDQEAARAAAGGQSPYKGLLAFRARDNASFFGRYRAVLDMIAIVKQHRLLAVAGLSGSGKSSAVRAGLIPELQAGAFSGEGLTDSKTWFYPEPIVPGADPLGALIAAWGPIAGPEDLPRLLDARRVPVVLAIDQFEEVFTLAPEEADHLVAVNASRQLFLDALVAAASSGSQRHVVIITIRSEFDSYVRVNEAFAGLFDAGRYVISALRAGELRNAIELPAQRLGVGFEAGLVSELVNSVLGEPAGLPLLQFTLQELWKRRPEGSPMRMQDYKDLGGNPRDILARRADEIFDAIRLDQDKVLSRRIFLELVTTGSGQEATSRRLKRSALDVVSVARDNVNSVLCIWRDAGLIRISPAGEIGPDSDVEVAHEALVRNWSRLVEWVEENFAAVRNRHAFRLRAERWEAHPEETLGELALSEAKGYERLDPLETRFVNASEAAVAKAKADLAAQHQRWFVAAVFMISAEICTAVSLVWWMLTFDDPPLVLIMTTIALSAVAVLLVQWLVSDIVAEALASALPRVGINDGARRTRWAAVIRRTFRWTSGVGIVIFGLIALWRLSPDYDKPLVQSDVDYAKAGFNYSGKPSVSKLWPAGQKASPTLQRVVKSIGVASPGCGTAPTVFMIAPNVAIALLFGNGVGPVAAREALLGTVESCVMDFSGAGEYRADRRYEVTKAVLGPGIPGAADAAASYSQIVFLTLAPVAGSGALPLPPPLELALTEDSASVDEQDLGTAVVGYASTQFRQWPLSVQAVVAKEVPTDGKTVIQAQFRSQGEGDPSFVGGPLIDLSTGNVVGINIGSNNVELSRRAWTIIMTINKAFIGDLKAKGVAITVAPAVPAVVN